MHTIELVTTDGKSIYRGPHNSLNEAIEFAIIENISLDKINLSNAVLHHINLDGVQLRNASFKGADLTGANMSEADFTTCDFSETNLKDACLCYSNFNDCNFRLSIFKGTDIAMMSLINCAFEGFETFRLKLHKCFQRHNLTYTHHCKTYPMNSNPILIQSNDMYIAIIDKLVFLKDTPHTLEYNNMTKAPISNITQMMQSLVDSTDS